MLSLLVGSREKAFKLKFFVYVRVFIKLLCVLSIYLLLVSLELIAIATRPRRKSVNKGLCRDMRYDVCIL